MESTIRFCQNCGAKLEGALLYCVQCGAALPRMQESEGGSPDARYGGDAGASSSRHDGPEESEGTIGGLRACNAGQTCAEESPSDGGTTQDASALDRSTAPRVEAPDDRCAAQANPSHKEETPTERPARPETTDVADAPEILAKLAEDVAELKAMFSDRIARTDYETATMKKLSDEVQDYREDLYRKLTLPFMKDLIEVRNTLMSTVSSCKAKGEETVPLSTLDIFSNMVRDALESHGVEVVEAAPGEKADPARHKVIGRVPTADAALHGLVVSHSNDCYMLGDECLSPSLVTVYCCEKSR